MELHKRMAFVLDLVVDKIKEIKDKANDDDNFRPIWPMIILKTPKGWTGPKQVDNNIIEGSFRSHQVPIIVNKDNEDNLALLEEWLKHII